MERFKTSFVLLVVAVVLAAGSCSRDPAAPTTSAYPVAVDLEKVGQYPALAKSGGGYFYDEVLEYRVWFQADGGDTYRAFATYEEAKRFSDGNEQAEEPLVLVLQREHVNEPQPGVFEHVKGDRSTEWQVDWLEGSKRGPDSIPAFLREKAARP